MCVRACVRACVWTCVRACVRACVIDPHSSKDRMISQWALRS